MPKQFIRRENTLEKLDAIFWSVIHFIYGSVLPILTIYTPNHENGTTEGSLIPGGKIVFSIAIIVLIICVIILHIIYSLSNIKTTFSESSFLVFIFILCILFSFLVTSIIINNVKYGTIIGIPLLLLLLAFIEYIRYSWKNPLVQLDCQIFCPSRKNRRFKRRTRPIRKFC